jgi:hypothetical protein
MQQFGGKSAKKSSSDSKRHFTVVMGGKEHGLYVSSTPSSAARKAVTKLCTANKSKKVEFSIREITQGSKKKTYGPYSGYIEKLKEPIELKGRVIKYKPVAKLSGKKGVMKGGKLTSNDFIVDDSYELDYKYKPSFLGTDKLFFGPKIKYSKETYFPYLLLSTGVLYKLNERNSKLEYQLDNYNELWKNPFLPEPNDDEFNPTINNRLKSIIETRKEKFGLSNNNGILIYQEKYESAKNEYLQNPNIILKFDFKWFS